ncbi:MAG: metal-dependent transcriptional regulator [Gemmatimonadota bacterium]|nr:metal-dependent transcriptional regulator [Gemmatimonadota bacterium]MDH4349679.1 metal-dependent transcriptional regulator [Gemmatimonadota bacterium]MDH5196982.1 metal-dependent transcriptional regulator [Gemmatimonadota bacterium]
MPQSSVGLSQATEDYLKAIYGLAGDQERAVQTTDLAGALAISPASVSGMLRRLSKDGLLSHLPYRGVRLTATGRRLALRVVRRHRILECYLTNRLGYDWNAVHAEAERLEHAVSDELVERMALVLGDPPYDPHGAPIPTRDGEIAVPSLIPLAEVPIGTLAELRMVDDKDAERLRYLTSLGLEVGTRFEVVDRQPFDGPVTIGLPGRPPVALGLALARTLGCRIHEPEPRSPPEDSLPAGA